mgnify:CR=1 FL=1
MRQCQQVIVQRLDQWVLRLRLSLRLQQRLHSAEPPAVQRTRSTASLRHRGTAVACRRLVPVGGGLGCVPAEVVSVPFT